MKANIYCGSLSRFSIDIYLDGVKVPDAMEADEDNGYVYAAYRSCEGRMVPEFSAWVGALIHDGCQVVRLVGKVEIRITPPVGTTEEDIRQECLAHFHPIYVVQIVQGASERGRDLTH